MTKGKGLIISAVFLLFLSASVCGEVLFEREPDTEVIQKYGYSTLKRTIYLNANLSKKQIIKKASKRGEGDSSVLRIELLQDANQNGRPYFEITYVSKVLFEREVEPSVLRRHKIRSRSADHDSLSKEELKERIANIRRNETILRYELFYDPQRNNKPRTRVIYLGEDLIEKARREEWFEYAKKNLSCAKDSGQFRYVDKSRSYNFSTKGRAAYMFYDEQVEIGTFSEYYVGPRGEHTPVCIYEVKGKAIDIHNFLRRIIREECRVRRSRIGIVVESRDKWAKTSEGGAGHDYSWLSGPHIAVYVGALGIDPKPLIDLYGAKFPSTLPKDFRIDKTAWGRKEVEIRLGRMKKAIEKKDNEKELMYRMRECAYKIGGTMYVPFWQKVYLSDEDPFEKKKAMYEEFNAWWQKNKAHTYWHEREQRLAVRGQAPEDIAAEKRRKAEMAREAKLNAPITEAKKKEIISKLIEKFEKIHKDRMEGADPDERFERVGEGKWIFEFRSDYQFKPPLTRNTYWGPKLEPRPWSRRYPFKGVFSGTQAHPGEKVIKIQEEFYYDKLGDRWVYKSQMQKESGVLIKTLRWPGILLVLVVSGLVALVVVGLAIHRKDESGGGKRLVCI